MKSHLTLLLAHICPNYSAFKQGLKYLSLFEDCDKIPKNHANFPMLLQSMGDGKSQKKFKDVWGDRAWAMEKARRSSRMFGGTNRQCFMYFCILVPHFEENVHLVLL